MCLLVVEGVPDVEELKRVDTGHGRAASGAYARRVGDFGGERAGEGIGEGGEERWGAATRAEAFTLTLRLSAAALDSVACGCI
eukprot:82951-Pleurochrysis_carterae.AAC.1